jgi:hypothetical protein
MNILLLNPNTRADITDLMLKVGQRAAAPGTSLTPLTAPRGVPYISTRAEAQIGGAVALEMLAECHREFDGAIIAAFGDPGLFAARECSTFLSSAWPSSDAHGMHGRTTIWPCHARGHWAPGSRNAFVPTDSGNDAGIRMLDGPFREIAEVGPRRKTCCRIPSAVKRTKPMSDLAGAPLSGWPNGSPIAFRCR